ncbi:MAG: hypothetical protein ABIL01_31995 [Pseudomonadota bacterium]
MNFKLTIDNQTLILKLEAILALFGKSRTTEFAEGKWTPFVFFELDVPADTIPKIHHIEFTGMTKTQINEALEAPPRDIVDFAGFVRGEIEKIEAARA